MHIQVQAITLTQAAAEKSVASIPGNRLVQDLEGND